MVTVRLKLSSVGMCPLIQNNDCFVSNQEAHPGLPRAVFGINQAIMSPMSTTTSLYPGINKTRPNRLSDTKPVYCLLARHPTMPLWHRLPFALSRAVFNFLL